MNTGEVIKFLRKRDGLTQEALAKALMLQRSSIQKYEAGIVQSLKLETIQKLSEIFQVAPYAFVYPDLWGKHQKFYEEEPTVHEMIALYTALTKEGKQKTISYMEDLSKIKQYTKADAEKYHDFGKLFPWMGKANGRH